MIATIDRRRLLNAVVLGGAATAATGACSSAVKPKAAPASDKVTYVTGLGLYGREGYAHVAQALGFFTEEHIEVKIVPGQAGDFNTNLLATGQAQFGVIDYAGLLIRAAAGGFRGMRAVAAINGKTMVAIMTLFGRGIAVPADLKGRTVFQAQGSVIMRLWPGYARLAGVDPASVHWQEVAAPTLPALLASGTAPAIGQFVVGAPAIAEAARRPLSDVIVLPYSDFMTDLYGNVVIASAQVSPDLTRRFVRALLRGLAYAITNPDQSGNLLHKAVPATNAATAAAEMRLMKPYVNGSNGGQLGLFDRPKVARSIALLQGLGLVTGTLNPDNLIDFSAVTGAASR